MVPRFHNWHSTRTSVITWRLIFHDFLSRRFWGARLRWSGGIFKSKFKFTPSHCFITDNIISPFVTSGHIILTRGSCTNTIGNPALHSPYCNGHILFGSWKMIYTPDWIRDIGMENPSRARVLSGRSLVPRSNTAYIAGRGQLCAAQNLFNVIHHYKIQHVAE